MANYIKYQLRGDTAENWERVNPVLLDREPGYDKTARRFKVGDGVTAWNDLEYVKPEVIANLLGTSDTDALSASQGAVLKGLIPPIVDNLTTSDSSKALSAKQGVVLKGLIPPVVNNLTDTSSEAKTKKVLSAYQGYYIKSLLDKKADSSTVTTLQTTVNNHTTNITKLQTLVNNAEQWTFTLSTGSKVTKKVVLSS